MAPGAREAAVKVSKMLTFWIRFEEGGWQIVFYVGSHAGTCCPAVLPRRPASHPARQETKANSHPLNMAGSRRLRLTEYGKSDACHTLRDDAALHLLPGTPLGALRGHEEA